MIALGEHWQFIAAAYIGTAVVVGGLIGWTALGWRRAKQRVAELEAARPTRKARS